MSFTVFHFRLAVRNSCAGIQQFSTCSLITPITWPTRQLFDKVIIRFVRSDQLFLARVQHCTFSLLWCYPFYASQILQCSPWTKRRSTSSTAYQPLHRCQERLWCGLPTILQGLPNAAGPTLPAQLCYTRLIKCCSGIVERLPKYVV